MDNSRYFMASSIISRRQSDSTNARPFVFVANLLTECRQIEMVLSPYLLQPTLNQFPPAPEGSKQDMCRFSAIQAHSQTFFPSAIWLWNTLPVDICQLSPESFKTHLNSFHFTRAPVCVLFLSSALHCFHPKLLFIVCCTAFSVHICLFTHGAILLGIESAPLSEDDETFMSSA